MATCQSLHLLKWLPVDYYNGKHNRYLSTTHWFHAEKCVINISIHQMIVSTSAFIVQSLMMWCIRVQEYALGYELVLLHKPWCRLLNLYRIVLFAIESCHIANKLLAHIWLVCRFRSIVLSCFVRTAIWRDGCL